MITKDEILNLILDIFETKDFLKIYISSPRNKSTKYFKINASTKKISDKYCIQFAMYFEDKVKHVNIFDINELRKLISECCNDVYFNYKVREGKVLQYCILQHFS